MNVPLSELEHAGLSTMVPYHQHNMMTTDIAGTITHELEFWDSSGYPIATSRFIPSLQTFRGTVNIHLVHGLEFALFVITHMRACSVKIHIHGNDVSSLKELLAEIPQHVSSVTITEPTITEKTSGRIVYIIANALLRLPHVTHISINTDHLTPHRARVLAMCFDNISSLDICGNNINDAMTLIEIAPLIRCLQLSAGLVDYLLRGESNDFINLLKRSRINKLILNHYQPIDVHCNNIINDILCCGNITELNMFAITYLHDDFIDNINNLTILRFTKQQFTDQQIIKILQRTKLEQLINVSNNHTYNYDSDRPHQCITAAFESNITMIRCDPVINDENITKYLERNKSLRKENICNVIIDLCMILYVSQLTPYIVIEIFDWLEPCHRRLDHKFIERICLRVYRLIRSSLRSY